MENWQKDFWQMVQTLTDEVELFFVGMTEMVDTFFEFTEELGEQVHSTIVTELDQYLQDINESPLEMYWELDDLMGDGLDPGFPYSVEATTDKNPACMGCRHYHGHAYGGNLLVCGMHPSGWEDTSCPDWEQEY
jgi:hypothetical protein